MSSALDFRAINIADGHWGMGTHHKYTYIYIYAGLTIFPTPNAQLHQ